VDSKIREENIKTDNLSRVIDLDDWGVSIEFFNFIDGLWGKHTVDRFADNLNAKISKFNYTYWSKHVSAGGCFFSFMGV
jgi:hypothetical protein